MTRAIIDDFEARQEALIRALDGNDVAGIEAATAELADALTRVRALGGPDGTLRAPDPRALAARAQAAQARVNFLTDRIGRRIDRLAVLRGRLPSATYRSSR